MTSSAAVIPVAAFLAVVVAIAVVIIELHAKMRAVTFVRLSDIEDLCPNIGQHKQARNVIGELSSRSSTRAILFSAHGVAPTAHAARLALTRTPRSACCTRLPATTRCISTQGRLLIVPSRHSEFNRARDIAGVRFCLAFTCRPFTRSAVHIRRVRYSPLRRIPAPETSYRGSLVDGMQSGAGPTTRSRIVNKSTTDYRVNTP